MPDKDRLDLIYSRGYSITVMAFSLLSVILLLASDFAWWQDATITHVRLSSAFRLSILIILPLILAFFATGVFAGMVYFVDSDQKDLWKKLIFWIALGILGVTIIAAAVLLIVFSNISISWGYGAGFVGSTLGSIIITLVYLVYFKIQQEIRT
ncbi:MAG: hypothetical protein ACTSRE_13890 [Promethearchaeota archaeon]